MTSTRPARTTVTHRDLPASRGPHIQDEYRPKNIKKPSTTEDWANFVYHVAGVADNLSQHARRLQRTQEELEELAPGDYLYAQLDQERVSAVKRAVKGCQELAFAFLRTGCDREELGDLLNHCGMQQTQTPDYQIPLLYSKLLGLEFAEVRSTERISDAGEVAVAHRTENKRYTWAVKIKEGQIQDFATTMQKLDEDLSELQGRFERGVVQLAYMPH